MPVAAFIDEGHLPILGLTNAWGYNPVTYFAPDPRLAPRGIGELRNLTDLYRKNGISVILDVVYNHTGESDADGPILSMKGLDARTYYRHTEIDGKQVLINDAGTGNTLACDHPAVQRLVIESLTHGCRRPASPASASTSPPFSGAHRGSIRTPRCWR
jgi:glycogen operon protein